jgi:hypothetical protein
MTSVACLMRTMRAMPCSFSAFFCRMRAPHDILGLSGMMSSSPAHASHTWLSQRHAYWVAFGCMPLVVLVLLLLLLLLLPPARPLPSRNSQMPSGSYHNRHRHTSAASISALRVNPVSGPTYTLSVLTGWLAGWLAGWY